MAVLEARIDREFIRDRLKRFREQHGFTIAELAERLGVRPSTVANWEGGRKNFPSIEDLDRLAQLYHISLAELLAVEPLPRTPKQLPEVLGSVAAQLEDEAARLRRAQQLLERRGYLSTEQVRRFTRRLEAVAANSATNQVSPQVLGAILLQEFGDAGSVEDDRTPSGVVGER
jgi:transcriptional regulator with XRE-family HTH domain